jgi:RND family efflux transporter MFP subunit
MAQKAEIEKAKFPVKEQEVQLQYYKITAPYSGIIGDIPVKTGSFVTPQSQLLNITQNNVLEINAGLPTEKIFEIKTGLPVEVLDNNGKVVATSKISFVSPVVNTDTQTVLVKASLNNPQGVFKADQSLKIRVIYNKAPGLLAPTSAISHFGGQDFVYTVSQKDKKSFVKQQPVKLGNLQGDKYVVISGLKEGDTIVSQGIQKLMDGAPVTIMPEGK